uniref:Sugar transporter SWEET n=1 Tax=Ciona intestinalis TaxID=7719 RepID=A0A1W2WL76_CIOIN|nr:sugar transporter SWEET1-like [Ciona intestinalis]|eukprot:XP_004227494.1 sugar transporter SWEET1-like [Ciona intestinalis]
MDWGVVEIVSFVATVTNVLLFLSGIQIISKIYTRGSSQGFSVLPFIVCFVSSTLWTKYGLLSEDSIMILVNFIGVVIEGFYTAVFYLNTKQKQKKLQMTIFSLLAFMFAVLIYTKYFVNQDLALKHHGFICAAFNIINYAAPLSSAAVVIRKKSTENLSLLLSVVYFLVSVEWFFYGYLHQDNFIMIPNTLGILFCSFQLSLFVFYPSKRTISDHKPDIVTF